MRNVRPFQTVTHRLIIIVTVLLILTKLSLVFPEFDRGFVPIFIPVRQFDQLETKEQLITRTGKNGVGRFEFLKLLVTEFKTSKSQEAKTQVLANLANFAYDPVNYEYLRQLQIIDLFLHLLSEENKDFVRFAVGGICNLCLDPENKDYIIHSNGPQMISSLLTSSDEETVLSSITALMFLITPISKPQITNPENITSMIHLSNSSNYRIKNLASIFLSDYCSKTDVDRVRLNPSIVPVSAIPLPD